MATEPQLVRLDVEGAVAVVSLDRPERHNAFTNAMDDQLFALLADLHVRRDVRAVVWRGEGRSFSSGRDTSELGVRESGQSDYDFIEQGHDRTRLLLTIPMPIIVALKGWVLGGSFERALLCDLRIAAEDARMALPEVQHGVIPDSGGVARLFQMAGHGVAADLSLTGRVIDAEEALRLGIVSRVVANDDLDDAALEMATAIASRSPFAVKLARKVIADLATPAVEQTLRTEHTAQSLVFASADYAEIKAAHRQGREPVFGEG